MESTIALLPPMTRPMNPPVRQSVTASIRNWGEDVAARAPTAMRSPISLVPLSHTDTIMIFIMPMSPTMSETAAVAPSHRLRIFCISLLVRMGSATF
jgi:hypothetical protein